MRRPTLVFPGVLLGVLLGGCVSTFPDEALRGVNRTVTLGALRAAPGSHLSERVIVGGEILATRPKVGETEIEVLARRLRSDGSPERSDRSEGRFLVRTAEFLDPAVYAAERRITVLGTVAGEEERSIGDLPYRYPVIQSERIRLWPRDVATTPAYPPGFYDPYWPYWGGPWRPYRFWRPWPYWW